MKKILLILLTLALCSQAFAEYNIVDRTRLIEDRLKLQEALRPLGHDFYLDVNTFFSGDIMDLADDLSAASTRASSGEDAMTVAADLTDKWTGKELSGRANFGAGIPLFQFSAWGIKFVPELIRADFSFTTNVAISDESLEPADFVDFLPADIPEEIRDVIASLTVNDIVPNPGDIDGGAPGDTNPQNLYVVLDNKGTVDPFILAAFQGELESIVLTDEIQEAITDISKKVPNLDLYLKVDGKIGPKVAWYGKNFFGHVNLYALARVDTFLKITSATLTSDGAGFDAPSDIEETNLTIDAAVGYRMDNFSIIASMDEVKIANLSEADDANNLYGTPTLFKVYGEMNFKPFDFMKLKAFGGFHMREGYGIGDGYYLGADLGAYVWGDRLGIQFRTQLDAEHITLAPQFKFWVMQLEGMYKLPITDDVDGRKPGSILGANLRIFI